MNKNLTNAIWILVNAVLFYFYYTKLAGYWIEKEGVDPLLVNVVYIPLLFGLLTAIGLKGETALKAKWLVVMPIVPCLVLGQHGDAAKPDLQWIILLGLLFTYFAGGAMVMTIQNLLRKRTPNKSLQSDA